MGERKGIMLQKIFLLGIILVFVFLSSGCNTVAGASKGAAEGAKKDYEDAKKADEWMRKSLW
jgi:predicted small secreted protein